MRQESVFLSCDWGTTAFRLRLADASTLRIIAESAGKEGNATLYESWRNSGEDRLTYYQNIVRKHIRRLEQHYGSSLTDVPLIISGMASSNIGMMELPYKPMPFALDGSDLLTKALPATEAFPYPSIIISGVQTEDDVMRGEEVQVVGCDIKLSGERQMIIHPGTHCKHIIVQDGQAVSFQTYMTGELFSLLSTKSILAGSVAEGSSFESCRSHFEDGVRDAASHNPMHAFFLVRTASLFQKRSKEANYYYLSGLTIGTELSSFPKDFSGPVILAGEPALVASYKAAMDALGISGHVRKVTIEAPDAITLKGQWMVYNHQLHSH